jgi:hypothetical protein
MTDQYDKDCTTNRRVMRRLVREHGGKIMAFRDLPRPAQLSMAHYMAINGEAWEVPEGFNERFDDKVRDRRIKEHSPAMYALLKRMFARSLPHYVREHGDQKFGLVTIPTAVMTAAMMKTGEHSRDYPTWEAYHQWYLSSCGEVTHTRRNPWPVILDDDHDELLQDGWHRFHRYVQIGLPTIPCLYYPWK